MVRLALLADIHGNLPALEAVLDDAEQHRVDSIIVAGDLTGGAQDVGVIQQLRSLDSWMIRGNREEYLLDFGHTGKHWAFLRCLYHRLDSDTLDFIATLPDQRVVAPDGAEQIRIVHGSPQNSRDMLLPEHDSHALQLFEQAGLLSPSYNPPRQVIPTLDEIDENVLVCGHTHIPWVQKHERRLAINPGSVGLPINGDPRAQYALLSWQSGQWQTEHRAIPYDVSKARVAFQENGLLENGGGFARACFLTIGTGQNIAGRLIEHAHQVAAQAGLEKDAALPDSMWEHIERTFDWKSAVSNLQSHLQEGEVYT
jgi:putative phosphoesterase